MKSAFTAFLILSFLAMAVFGFLAMNHNDGQKIDNCLAAKIKGTDCIGAYKSFSLAVLVFFSFFFFAGFLISRANSLLPALKFSKNIFESLFVSFKNKTIRWLSLLENSPNLISRTLL